MLRWIGVQACVLAAMVAPPLAALAQKQSASDLAKQSQNPVAAMISLPFQNNTFFGIGPDDDTANVLNIQPVIPVNLGGGQTGGVNRQPRWPRESTLGAAHASAQVSQDIFVILRQPARNVSRQVLAAVRVRGGEVILAVGGLRSSLSRGI